MKTQKLVNELVALGIYSVDSDRECSDPDKCMTITDSNYMIRRVKDNGITDEELKLLLLAKQTSYLRTIKWIAVFCLVFTIMMSVLFIVFFILPAIN